MGLGRQCEARGTLSPGEVLVIGLELSGNPFVMYPSYREIDGVPCFPTLAAAGDSPVPLWWTVAATAR